MKPDHKLKPPNASSRPGWKQLKHGQSWDEHREWVQAPTFNGNTSWAVFRRQFETVAEHSHWSDQEKSTYLITSLMGRAANVLHSIPTNTTYEGTLQALEDQFGSHLIRVPLETSAPKERATVAVGEQPPQKNKGI
jgi:hypothetical protein